MAKFVVDAEQCAMAYRMAEGIRWDDFDEGLAAVADIGPGGHCLGHAHTLANFQRAFFMPDLFDNNAYEQCQRPLRNGGTRAAAVNCRAGP